MTPVTPTTRRRVTDLVGDAASAYITELQRGYHADASGAVAALAQLRRGAGKLPEDVPELWGMAGTERLYADGALPETEAVRAEAALFLAVTLYALHQQSRPEQRMHRAGVDLGTAVRRLMPGGAVDEPIRRRFVRAGTADTREALAYRLREIVSLLRRESIPLDYALLARQLYQAQLPEGLRQVRQSWGRSFHSYRPDDTEAETRPDDTASTDKDAP
ncbi:CRISPR system Cascade subunit CasB [Streptosporangium becharense]|uniref:CRISPR system Cascade subunit CasB n=1 Tax=Streptosporangium becharense TaxID=1816182 RepID=A0A7W9IM16_9ACTN|nr:type I-E CRISPR-associated protein Cse2/CasB [Streptosporangium becharense]MBB2910399.1 CRISPR system Cascade subunit CasB [Streptosporangium becharense]MBB5823142.1 CRISPR system Cascade subunit CasB [Streptosporangium becharense]